MRAARQQSSSGRIRGLFYENGKFSMPFRVQDRYFENTVKAGGTSLMQMWKQGLEEEKRKKEEDAKRLDAERPQQNADSG
ncbi:hypothetical protein TESG_08562 [Trichophyton tonsurans CBS 112818]|uniref:Uncharacterized protein n=1 Tax=Trichophyton tonsurans (strain CBS 112818) TaxID=647933 RepID=F2S4V9_TRIT1|nr:hypothetical protein TESG_08562 [Trichophyton tonsurans CBS 112818]